MADEQTISNSSGADQAAAEEAAVEGIGEIVERIAEAIVEIAANEAIGGVENGLTVLDLRDPPKSNSISSSPTASISTTRPTES